VLTAAALAIALGLSAAPAPAQAAGVTPIIELNTPFASTNQFAHQRFVDGSQSQLGIATLSRGIIAAGTDSTGTSISLTLSPAVGRPPSTGHFTLVGSGVSGVPDPSLPTVALVEGGQGGQFAGDLDILDLGWDGNGTIQRFDVVLQGLGEFRMNEAGDTEVHLGARHLTFPRTPVGLAPVFQREWVRNVSGATVALGSVSTGGQAGADFAVSSNSCGSILAAGATCSFEIGFSPKAASPRTAALSMAIGGVTQIVTLAGSAPLGTTSLTYSGNDFVSEGTKHVYADGPYAIDQFAEPIGYEFRVNAPYGEGGPQANMVLNALGGGPLTLGHHTTVDVTDEGKTSYGARLTAQGRGCGDNNGSEDVNAFSMGNDGLASMVNISFTQICTADPAHPMTGSLLWQWRYDTQAPTAPSAVTAAPAVGGAVTWTASPSGDTAHTIARLVPGAATQLSPTAGFPLSDGTATQATIPAVTAGTHTVAVFAVDGAGNVSKPGVKTITIGSTTPVVTVQSAPTLLSVVVGDGSATCQRRGRADHRLPPALDRRSRECLGHGQPARWLSRRGRSRSLPLRPVRTTGFG
jgi:hypothetical protein